MNIKIEGIDELRKKLKDNVQMDDVKRVVRHNGQQMTNKMIKNADFKRGYATGQTKRSITLEIEDGGMTARTGPETEYAPCINIGRSIWKHIFKNRAKSVEILENIV